MSALTPLVLGTEESRMLQEQIKQGLKQRKWSEGDDDEVMAEYILVMLANNKTQEQIASELRELLGDGSGEGSNGEGVDAFVEWIWLERVRIGAGGDVKTESQSAGTSEAKSREQWRGKETRRRSLSPHPRPDTNGSQLRGVDQSGGRAADRWDESNRRGQPSTHARGNHRQGRELLNVREPFVSHRGGPENGNGRTAADNWHEASGGRRELLGGHEMDGGPRAAMDDPSLQVMRRRTPANSVIGQGGRNLFKRSLDETQQQPHQAQAGTSLFSRLLVPDPRAADFVPSSQSQATSQQGNAANLLSRLDPMVPTNIVADTAMASDSARDTSFPLQPQDVSLCRYSLGCTNPMCFFSHPSASAVSLHKKTGKEPLVLKQDPCRFQKDCTNVDCAFSHVSPAVTFVTAKAGRDNEGAASGGAAACRFQMECKNAACTYAHYDPQTHEVVPSPAAAVSTSQDSSNRMDSALSSDIKACRFGASCTRKDCHFSHPPERQPLHISDRLSRFADGQVDGEMEVIIPVA